MKSGFNPLLTKKKLDNILKVCYNKYNKRKGTDIMWYIVSKSGLRGIEKYTSEAQAWQAADLRNSLINQGWHPVRVA